MRILTVLLMTLSMNTIYFSQETEKGVLDFFREKISIPQEFQSKGIREVKVDNKQAYLFRYEKNNNNGIGGEHFSFLVTKDKPYTILGFTRMDVSYSVNQYLSREETEKIARDFLEKIDPDLNRELTNLWIEPHDEEITIGNKRVMVKGMKYKCYRKKKEDYAWVIVGSDGSVVTFERDILWDNEKHERITNKWLHDSWLNNK